MSNTIKKLAKEFKFHDESLDINALLDKVDTEYLKPGCQHTMIQEMMQAIQEFGISTEKTHILCEKLTEYRLVDQIHLLHKGKHIRWIRAGDDKLTNGGVVVDIKFLDTGSHILCKNGPRFLQIPFDDCLIFQKLTADELLLLHCYSMLESQWQ
jgi:hypothetical protein